MVGGGGYGYWGAFPFVVLCPIAMVCVCECNGATVEGGLWLMVYLCLCVVIGSGCVGERFYWFRI